MLLMAVPNVTKEPHAYNEEHIRALKEILADQLEDLTELSTIIGYLKGFKEVGIDRSEQEKYDGKMERIEEKQQIRFDKMDEMIFGNRREIKKEKTHDGTILLYGKEVRKLEAGLRTLRLFTDDVIKMLAPASDIMNRVDDRIGYFEKRSAGLEAEMKMMMERLAAL